MLSPKAKRMKYGAVEARTSSSRDSVTVDLTADEEESPSEPSETIILVKCLAEREPVTIHPHMLVNASDDFKARIEAAESKANSDTLFIAIAVDIESDVFGVFRRWSYDEQLRHLYVRELVELEILLAAFTLGNRFRKSNFQDAVINAIVDFLRYHGDLLPLGTAVPMMLREFPRSSNARQLVADWLVCGELGLQHANIEDAVREPCFSKLLAITFLNHKLGGDGIAPYLRSTCAYHAHRNTPDCNKRSADEQVEEETVSQESSPERSSVSV